MPLSQIPSLLRPARRRGFTVMELMTVVVVIGILAAMAWPNFTRAADKARNASVQASVHTVRLAAEQFMVANNATYPNAIFGTGAADDYMIDTAGLNKLQYFAGERLPVSPWASRAGKPQSGNIALAGVTFQTASAVANGTSISSTKDQMIGRGANPDATTGPAAVTDFGAILYEHDASASVYVIYGVGKRGQYAVVSQAISNQSN